jgi:hypothetical protein
MQELCNGPESTALRPVNHLDYLVENAARCFRLARSLLDPDFTQQLIELGNEYAAQAIERGADPATLPDPDGCDRLINTAEWPALDGGPAVWGSTDC